MVHEGIDYETASAQQQRTDRAREAYVTHFHPEGGAWGDPRHYHLMIDSTAVSLDACVELIVLAAQDLFAGRPGQV
jgi:hypothetical protein